jgi:predicted amidohydrolase YtcJ
MRLLLSLAFALLATAAVADPADLIIRGGPIYTGVAAPSEAEVVVVQGGRITYVGAGANVRLQSGPNTRSST